ncbi:hypothetical protein RHMOL_Rhmol02G0069400 [Rhododendron molle]|uniref:Uncharacterized protein n=4 Tax=Rhododendron molle TaxID=49168 RepID=A0ACC0PMT7_RHOML|nr:hypothetical protein RHMOL_Rhmol02G0069400 [Rhododendron molle]KAI8566791.1 hypothetical protein RHMOL_Rhmol02G0069400 [Rhododendron molle]KAI8566792.1 hypothetical protein RHMOL_Rhmol02G0069400 [Rhododendron molle]KAI8566793.1 hypothetical protein RHMOL_Rhmol02G0069400 [Rhododendron molle]
MQDGRSYFTDLLDVDDQPLNSPTQWLLASADVVTFNLSELCFRSCATLLCLVFLLKNGSVWMICELPTSDGNNHRDYQNTDHYPSLLFSCLPRRVEKIALWLEASRRSKERRSLRRKRRTRRKGKIKRKEKDRSDGKHRDKTDRKEKDKEKNKEKERDKDKDKKTPSEDKRLAVQSDSNKKEKLDQKHSEREKDKDKDKNSISEEKKWVLQFHGHSGDTPIRNSLFAEGNGEFKFVQELCRRIRDEEEGTGSQLVDRLPVTEWKNVERDRVVLKDA